MKGVGARAATATTGILWVGLALGCAGLPLAPTLSEPPSQVAQSSAEAMIATGELPTLDCDDHGEILAWLVLEGPPDAAAASLAALRRCPDVPDRDVAAVVGTEAPEPEVAGEALRLAESLLADVVPGADHPVVDAVSGALAHPDKAVRYEAVEVFDTFAWTSSEALEASMLRAAADPSPPVVSEVLERAYDRAAGLRMREAWAMTARYALVAHLDPGIRGRGALLLARLQPEAETTRQLLRGALYDPHPHVQAVAATALAEAGDVGAIHLFVERLAKPESVQVDANWAMLPWTGTDGMQRTQVHEGSYFERVDDAMLRAAADLSQALEPPFELREMNLRYLELDLVSATRDLEAWHDEHGDALPTP